MRGMFERTGEGIDAMLAAVIEPDPIHVHARLIESGIPEEGKQRAGVFHRIIGPDARRIGQAAIVGDDALVRLDGGFEHMEFLQGIGDVEIAIRGLQPSGAVPGGSASASTRRAFRGHITMSGSSSNLACTLVWK
jgi:hypothetical protein